MTGTGLIGVLALMLMMHFLLKVEVKRGGKGAPGERLAAAFLDRSKHKPDLFVLKVPGGGGIELILRLYPKRGVDGERLMVEAGNWIWTQPDLGGRVQGAIVEVQDPFDGKVRRRRFEPPAKPVRRGGFPRSGSGRAAGIPGRTAAPGR